ncbi:MAG: hypothetical protein GX267_09625 [Fibrobacter sp.]|jgi:hypothetical protein|nr:hypothetical protein [Fibrobacter sp.]
MLKSSVYTLLSALFILFFLPCPVDSANIILMEKLDIAQVWAGHPVNFAIRTTEKLQCVAFYNTNRRMVVASRSPDSTSWKYTELPTTTGWDSHNYIAMAIDDSGYIHISGNMHNVNLIYFRSKKPWNTDSFESPGMIGTLENSITYPEFIEGPNNQLFFQYRTGGSGNGITICNSYDTKTKKWTRLTSKGLFDGENKVSAYHISPVLGPDNFFHIVWMWRETPVANTNFHISHMKSSDLITWQTMSGKSISIPVKTSTPDVVVDPISSGRGLINMDYWISWDRLNRAVITYHRYDDNNISQIFNTRWENGKWKIYQTSNWTNFKWNLDREGSLSHDIAATLLSIDENGELIQDYVYPNQKMKRWILNEETLKPQSDIVYESPQAMRELYEVESTFPGLQVNRIRDGEYYLRWETMPINQDKSRPDGTYPPASTLRVYRFSIETEVQKRTRNSSGKFYVKKNHSGIIITGDFKNAYRNISLTASVFSFNGKLILKKRFLNGKQCRISQRNLSTGVYLIKITQDKAFPDINAVFCEKVVLR